MKKNPAKLWGIVFALGWLFDFLFWDKDPGINFALFAIGCVAAAFYLLLGDGYRAPLSTLILLLPFGFFVTVTVFRAEPLTVFLAVVFTLLSMFLLTVSYGSGEWHTYTLGNYIVKAIQLLGSLIGRPIAFMSEVRQARKEAGIAPPKYNLMPVLRGILIALPVVAVFASLLASADIIFGQQLENLLNWFRLEKMPEILFRFTYIAVIGYALAGVVLHAANQSTVIDHAKPEKNLIPPFLGFTESSIVLGSVALLFAAFVVIQFKYFFGGNANIHIDGYTYSEYARRGFGELVTVAFFSLVMLFALNSVTIRETETQRRIYSGLGATLVALLLVMLFSAFKRLGLYEDAYGFSRLRTYTHVFLVWLGLLLVATIALEIARREKFFTFALLFASVGFAASLALLNVDAFIVAQNIQRSLAHPSGVDDAPDSYETVDTRYFIELSDDAIPPLVEAYKDPALPDSLREKLGAALVCIQNQRRENASQPWQSFHLAGFRANLALAQAQGEFDGYQYQSELYPLSVITPSGTEFICTHYFD